MPELNEPASPTGETGGTFSVMEFRLRDGVLAPAQGEFARHLEWERRDRCPLSYDQRLQLLRRAASSSGLPEDYERVVKFSARAVPQEERETWTRVLAEALLDLEGPDDSEAMEALCEGAQPERLPGGAVHVACLLAPPETLEVLVRCGLCIDARNALGWSPLAVANSRRRIELLLKLGAEVQVGEPAPGTFSRSPDGSDGTTVLHAVGERGWTDLAAPLLAVGASACLSVRDYVDRTPMVCAVSGGHHGVVRALAGFCIKHGIEWDRGPIGESALAEALRLADLKAVTLLAPGVKDRSRLVPFCEGLALAAKRPARKAALLAALSILRGDRSGPAQARS